MYKYFNNAGAGLMSKRTYDVITNHMQLEMEIGAYRAANERSDDVKRFYESSASLLKCSGSDEIAFIDSASRGWNLVMYGLNISSEDTIVTLSSEYGTNLLTIYDLAQKTGCKVKVIPCDETGRFCIEDVENELKQGKTILAVSQVAAQGAIVNPVEELGSIARKNEDTIYIVDGCQAVGQIPVNVEKIGCDAYVTAGRKWLRGPRGTGILYVRKGSPIRTPQIDLASADLTFDSNGMVTGVKVREDAKQFELWEKSTASLLGLANAVDEFIEYGEDKASNEISNKATIIRDHIAENANLKLVGQRDSLSGIAAFFLRDTLRENEVKKLFEDNHIIVSIICDWDCPLSFPKGVQSIFRLSPHYYTSDEDISYLCRIIDAI